MNKTAEGLGEFIIAGCEASRVLETVEATFDAIPQSANRSVDLNLKPPIFLRVSQSEPLLASRAS